MKIKLSLFFTVLFCFIIQNAFCTSQSTEVQTVQDTGVIHNVNNNISDTNLQKVVDNNMYISSDNNIDDNLKNQVTDNNYTNDSELENGIITNNISNNISSGNNLNDISSDNIIIIDDGTSYNDDLADDEIFLDNEIPYNDNITNNDTVTMQQKQSTQNNNKMQNNIQNNTKNNTTMQNNTLQNDNINNNMNSDTTAIEIDESVKKIDRVYVSLMFTEENIQDIFKALPASSTGIPQQYSLGFDDAQNRENDINKKTNLSIYLNSIMYISDNAWSLWLNGNKITNMSKNTGDIKVLKVTPLYVDFVWKISDLQWQAINKNNLIPQTNYKVDGDYVDLYFTLSPNQTYIPALNQILEGNQRQISDTTQGQDGNADGEGAVVNTETEELFF